MLVRQTINEYHFVWADKDKQTEDLGESNSNIEKDDDKGKKETSS